MTLFRSILAAALLAAATNAAQLGVQQAMAADLSGYWSRYVVGLRGCDAR